MSDRFPDDQQLNQTRLRDRSGLLLLPAVGVTCVTEVVFSNPHNLPAHRVKMDKPCGRNNETLI